MAKRKLGNKICLNRDFSTKGKSGNKICLNKIFQEKNFSTDLISTGDLPAGHRFDNIGHDGDGDEEAGDIVEYEGGG